MADEKPIRVFLSYAHEDERFKDELVKHLSVLRRQGLIDMWHDRKIVAGEDWAGEIDENLEAADLVLLLVSSGFLASDYCYEKEMDRAVERHDVGEARVVPIVVRACDWARPPLGKLQALPRDGKPVANWDRADDAWLDVVRGIQRVVEAHHGERGAARERNDAGPHPGDHATPSQGGSTASCEGHLDASQPSGISGTLLNRLRGDSVGCVGLTGRVAINLKTIRGGEYGHHDFDLEVEVRADSPESALAQAASHFGWMETQLYRHHDPFGEDADPYQLNETTEITSVGVGTPVRDDGYDGGYRFDRVIKLRGNKPIAFYKLYVQVYADRDAPTPP